MHNTLVNNLFKCGALSESIRERLETELRVDVAGNLLGDD